MSIRSEILGLIESIPSTPFKDTGVVADLTALMTGAGQRGGLSLQNTPGAYLHLVGESAQPGENRTQQFTQYFTQRWGVVLVAQSYNDAGGANAAAQMDDLVAAIDGVLLGKPLTDTEHLIERATNAGRLIRWTDQFYFYQAVYQTATRICITGG